MKIQLKRSNQLDGGSAKAPSLGYMEYGELAVNFNEADPCIFIKASDGAGSDSIVRIAGSGAESGGMPDGPTADRPSTPSNGDLYFDTDLNLIVYWDGSQWIPVSPGVITSDTAPTTSLYAAGTLWYNNDEAEGALYILYEDPAGPGANAGGKIWVQIAGSGGGGGSSVVVADNPPNAANEGDLWFDSESGRLYIWYVNTNSQGQWIDASPEGPDETQVGDLKYDIANEDLQYWDGNAWVSIGGIGSSVTTEEPTDPSNGDLWWNTADNTLYIWYEDGDTGQWVISVPQGSGGGSDSGEYVSKIDTDAQNIASDLTLGTDKITLDATDGSALFASNVVVGGDVVTDNNRPPGTVLLPSGQMRASGANADSDVLLFFTEGNGDFQYKVTANGQTTAGASTAQTINYRPGISGTGDAIWLQNPDNSRPFLVGADGSASFAGNLTIDKFPNPSLLSLGPNSEKRLWSTGGEDQDGIWLNANRNYGRDLGVHYTGAAVISPDSAKDFIIGTNCIDSSTGEIVSENVKISMNTNSGVLNVGPNAVGSDNPQVFVGSSVRRGGVTCYGPTETANSAGAFTCITTDVDGNQTTSLQLWQDGRGSFSNAVISAAIITKHPGIGSESSYACVNVQNSSDVIVARINADGSASFKGNVQTAGGVVTPSMVLQLEPDNDANYVSTTDVDEEGNTVETRVYNGPTLDVKDRLQNLIARLDALEADEISDDAASSALLTLIASLTARIDARDAVITDLTTRIQTLEGGNN